MPSRLLKTARLVTALMVAGLPFVSHAQSRISDGVVKIGVLTDMSGIFSELSGRGSTLATQMAIDDFVAETKPGFKVEMVFADHQNKADVGANKVREW